MGLEAFRVDAEASAPVPPARKGGKTKKAPWEPLRLDQVGLGTVLAWDQTIRNAGWCVLSRTAGDCLVREAGTCRTKVGEQRGWETTLSDAVNLFGQIRKVVDSLGQIVCRADFIVVHEAPPSGGGRLARPESSALAALGVRLVAQELGVPVTMVSNQSAKIMLTGNRSADKPEIGRAVMGLDWLRGKEKLTNEHTRDAAAVGLKWLSNGGTK